MANRTAPANVNKVGVYSNLPNGPAAAALLAGGIGAATMGIVTTLSEASTAFGAALNWVKPVGPLSGKVIVSVAIYLISWLILGSAYRGKEVDFNRIATIAFILLLIGLLGTFPPFFELFAAE
jgi:hypothetical protein